MESPQIIELLNKLLLTEFLQRDVYETYSYYLFGLCSSGLQEHLEEHRKQEDEHIRVLQRYLMGLGAEPLLKRTSIPSIDPPITNILMKDLELEREALKYYSDAVVLLEQSKSSEYIALRVDLENILVQEQEHVHDLMQWLHNDNIEEYEET